MVDFTGEFGQRAAARLQQDEIIWLTTVGRDGTPQPSPVWFLWEDDTVTIFSKPNAPKIANIRRGGQVALHFNTDAGGDNVVVLTGQAQVADESAADVVSEAYLSKYAEGIKNLGMSAEQMTTEYSAVIRFTPAKLRGF